MEEVSQSIERMRMEGDGFRSSESTLSEEEEKEEEQGDP